MLLWIPRKDALVQSHAGYSYSGPTAAWSFQQLQAQADSVKRVFILGPSHHVGFSSIALPTVEEYETPLGNLVLDKEVLSALHKTGQFSTMDVDVDEEEHSIEMQLPYIRKVTEGHDISIVPMMVGHLSARQAAMFADILTPYFEGGENFFVISSDFCHWGKRFGYQPYDPDKGAIHTFIESMDREGMTAIETLLPENFADYMKRTSNTICGRVPIQVMLHVVQQCADRVPCSCRFLHYSQSGPAVDMRDSSVSYAAGVVFDTSSSSST